MNTLKSLGCSSLVPVALALVAAMVLCLCAGVTWLTRLAYLHDADPQEYEAFIIDFLGIQGLYTQGVGPTFNITYWNGQEVNFWVPGEVWAASVAAGNEHGVDSWLIIATAFSESTQYNNSAESTAGALGVWQFIPSTWDYLWGSDAPPRTHIPSAAEAAARYLKQTGVVEAYRDGEESFVDAFASIPPVWNQHSGQARFVYELTRELNARDQGTFQPPYLAALTTTKWWSPYAILFLDMLGLMPEFKYAEGIVGVPGAPGLPPGASGNLPLFVIPSGVTIGEAAFGWICGEGWDLSQGLHGMNYGHMAYDVVCGAGSALFSPIEGDVTQTYIDGYGNTVIVIENDAHEVTLMHGCYTVEVDDHLKMGEHIGFECNFGNTWGYNPEEGEYGYCGTGSDCGHHSHLNVYDKESNQNTNPFDLLNQPQPEPDEEPPLPPWFPEGEVVPQ